MAGKEEEAREAVWRVQHNTVRHSVFVKSDKAPTWVCADPDLAEAGLTTGR